MTIHTDNTTGSTETPPAVYVEGLSFRYYISDDEPGPARKTPSPEVGPINRPSAIEDISFSLSKGELMLIAGPSGCGKSNLLKRLNGPTPHSYHGALNGKIQLG